MVSENQWSPSFPNEWVDGIIVPFFFFNSKITYLTQFAKFTGQFFFRNMLTL